MICAPMVRPKVPLNLLQSFGNINFANDYSSDSKISVDILVGLDFNLKFLDSSVSPQVEGLVSQPSVFGWVISGA